MRNVRSLQGEMRFDMMRFGVGIRTELDWELKNRFGVGVDFE